MPSLASIIRPLSIYCLALLATTFSALQAAELFVSDRATNRILSFDETTGEFLRVVTATGLDEPTGLAFGPGGFLYVSNLQAGVAKVDPDTGTTESDFIENVVGPGGIAYHAASDTLFVSEFGNFDGDEVFRYDASGTLLQTLGTGSAATGRAGITFDTDGNLYVSEANFTQVSSSPASVLKYAAPAGNPLDDYASTATTFASGNDVTLLIPAPASGFNGLAFDANGDLFVASLIGQSIIKYTVSGGVATSGAPLGAPLPYPSGLLIGSDGNLLATSLGNNNVNDPFYGPNLFPGELSRINALSGGSTPLLVGDSNHDDVVDGGDLSVFQAAYDLNNDGDLDGDLDTDGNDFLLWQRAFGNQGLAGSFQPTGIVRYVPPVESFAIPEPTSLCLVLLGATTVAFVCQVVKRPASIR